MEEVTKVPELRFRVVSGKDFKDWEERRHDQIFDLVSKKGNNALSIYSVTQKRGLVLRSDLDRDIINDSEKSSNLLVSKGDLVYNMMRMWQGAYGVANEDCLVSPAYVVARPTNELSHKYINYYFKRKLSLYKFWAFSYGITNDRLRLYGKDFLKIKLNLPSLPEQKKIADFLSTVDEGIDVLTRKKELIQRYKKGMLQQLFPRKGETIPQLRFKADDGSEFPEWEEKRLKDIGYPVKEKNKAFEVTTTLTNSAVLGIVNQEEYFDREISNEKNLDNYTIVNENDFIYNPRISKYAPVGPINRNKLGYKGVMSPIYSVFHIDKGDISFYDSFFTSSAWHFYMKSVANYGARHDRMNISQGDFYNLPIPYPSLPEQKKIAVFLSTIAEQIETVTSQIDHMKTWKRGLLQKMFV